MSAAQKLVESADYPAALEKYLWVLDHGTEVDPAFIGYRDTKLLYLILLLGEKYPAARTALQQRRDALEQALLAGRQLEDSDVYLYAAMNWALKDRERTLRVYEELRRAQSPRADDLYDDVFAVLLERKDYATILQREDWNRKALDQRSWILADAVASFRNTGVQLFESLAGVRRDTDALAVMAQIEKSDRSHETYIALMQHAMRAGNTDLAKAVLAHGRAALPADDQAALTEAAAAAGIE